MRRTYGRAADVGHRAACLAGGSTISYYAITKCELGCGRSRPGQTARLFFSGKISPVYWRMPRVGHPEDDYMSLPVL